MGRGLRGYEMESVQAEVIMGWSWYRMNRVWNGVVTGEGGYGREWVQDAVSMRWSGYRIEWV